MFLSIVIPVYNSAKYLPKCLDSIWFQSLPEDDFEVICIDDCSTDNSLEILEQEVIHHHNLRVLSNPKNLRAGGARNYGVREAKGEYILFIDSDDYFHPDSLLQAFNYQKDNRLDILMCDSSREMIDHQNNRLVHHFSDLNIMSGREFMLRNSLPFAPWKFFFKKSLMTQNNVWFEENVNCEDVDWTHKLAFYAQTMQYQPILLTHYVMLPDSETGAEYKNINTIRNRFFCGWRLIQLKGLFTQDEEKEHIERVACATYNVGIKNMCTSFSSPMTKKEIIDRYMAGVFHGLGAYIAQCPFTFSVLSTLVSPFFRLMIMFKRVLKGRH